MKFKGLVIRLRVFYGQMSERDRKEVKSKQVSAIVTARADRAEFRQSEHHSVLSLINHF